MSLRTPRRPFTRRRPNVTPRARLFLRSLEARDVPATFFVTNTLDGQVFNPGDLPGSLRQAIFDANALGGADIIDATTISGTITLAGGEFTVTGDTAINGPGAAKLTVDAGKLTRHFNISDDTTAIIAVSMSGMTLASGQAPTPPLVNPTFISGSGGSIYVRNERLTLDGMRITGSAAAPNFPGGGIAGGESAVPQQFNSSGQGFSLTVNNSQIDNNSTSGPGANAGGIYFSFPNTGVNFPNANGNFFSIVDSTVSNNTAGKRGGGIYFSGNAGDQKGSSFSMRNTTVSGNKSLNEFGGGVQINSTTGMPMSIVNSTITNNTAMTTPGGGGLVLNTGTGTITIERSIIADNFGPAQAPDIYTNSGATINARNNVIGSKVGISRSTIFNDLLGNVYGSAKLAPLANNGGLTQTHLPAFNSPALNPPAAVAVTTLTVAANNGFTGTPADNALTVASNAGLVVGQYIRIDSEVMLVTALAGPNGVTVDRSQLGTFSGTHAVGQAVNSGSGGLTTLSAAASAGATTVTVASTTNLAVGSFITVDSELAQITALSGSTVTLAAPLAAPHGNGAAVNSASVVLGALQSAITAGDTSVLVANTLGMAAGMSLQIDSEIVRVSQVTSTTLTSLVAPVTSSASTATVASTAGLAVGMNLTLENENVRLTAITNVATTLSAAVTTTTATLFTVTSATGITAGMLVLIDAEYVLVNSVIGTTLNVVRGQNGTTAATHANGAAVTSATITISRGQLGTTAAAHNSGVTVAAPTLTLLRGQDSTAAAAHAAGVALLLANDQRGNARRQGATIDVGAVEVNPATPAAVATVSNVTTSGGTTYTFTVTYSAAAGIDVSTLDGNDLTVSGPGGFSASPTFVGVDNPTNGSPRVATYSFTPPSGSWDYLDNGSYEVLVKVGQVLDTAVTPVPSAVVGRFAVAVGRSLLVTDANDSGPNTLRDAIEQANLNTFATDIITFDTVQMGTGIISVFDDLVITDPVVITGPGVTVDGGNATRVFRTSGPGNMAVSFSGLTVSNGQEPVTQFDSGIGSGILGEDDNLTLTNCTLTGNFGGGVALYSVINNGSLTIVGCDINNNTGGGVIAASSPFGVGHDVLIQNTSITDNTGSGFTGRTFSFNVLNTTIAKNTGATRGGGINIVGNFNSNGNSIVNSTITGNTAANSGGGIYMYWFPTNAAGQRVLIANTNIVGNFTNGGFQNEPGGGVNNRSTTAYLVDFENSVIASNTNSTVPDFNSKSAVLANNSFIGIHQPLNGAVVGFNNKLGSKSTPLDPMLAPLANNGGPTLTLKAYAGSSLIDVSAAAQTFSTLTYPMTAASTGFFVASKADLASFLVNNYVQIDSEAMRVVSTGMTPVTALTKALTAVDTTAYVQNTALLAVGMNLTLASEVVTVTAINSLALTTLTNDIVSTTGTALTLASTAGISTGLYLLIDSEYVRVTAVNNVATTLSAAIATAAATSCTVTSAAGITVGMVLQIDSEYVTVTAIAGTTLTITRGSQGSTAAAHAGGAAVTNSVTVARSQNSTVAATHSNGAGVTTGAATILRGQQGTTAAAQPTTSFQGPFVSVNSFIGGSFRGQLNTAAVAHAAGVPVIHGYTPPATDQRGAGFPRSVNGKVDIGGVEADPNIPSAVLAAAVPLINTPGQTPVTFSITFADNVAVNAATVFGNNNAIRVTGPNGYNQLASFVSIDTNTNGTPRTATYTVTSPGPVWNTLDNGFYTISSEPNQVADTGGTFVEAHALGTFRVSLTLNLVVSNDNDFGAGSLRDALDQANLNALAPDTISFDPAFFSTPRTITLAGGDLVISDEVTIVGPGAKFATLKGAGYRVFTINTPGNQAPILISGLTITGGNGDSSISAGVTPGGGGILNVDEAVTINNCVITKNDNSGAKDFSGQITTTTYGGGILLGNALASLTLLNSTVSDNSTGQSGGGISVRYGCVVVIDGCTISGNTAGTSSPSSSADGGGISAALGSSGGNTPTPTITLTNSTIVNNSAPQGGGLRMGNGVSNSKPAFLTVINCTFSGNVASGIGTGNSTGNGGAISIGNSTNWTIQNCTITGNYARVGGGGLQLGASITSPYGTTNGAIINTIIAGNNNRATPDIVGGASTTTFTLPVINSLIGAVDTNLTKINNLGSLIGTPASPIDALLGPLTTNGGLTATHLPLPGSPALNAGTTVYSIVLTTLSAAVTNVATTISVSAAPSMQVGQFIQVDAEIMQITAVSGTTVTVSRGAQSTTPAAHASGANVTRASLPTTPANDQRGVGFARQFGTIDIGAVEVNPAVPVAAGKFTAVTTPGGTAYTFTVTYTDDVAINVGSFGNGNVRITGPGGFSQLAKFLSAAPGTGAKVEVATYQFTPPGGSWDFGDDGLYSVSVETGQVNDGTNFVFPSVVNTFSVAIPRTFVVTNTNDTGVGSLRQAILDANANAGVTDVITFDPGVFGSPQAILLGGNEMTITDPVTITGPGSAFVTVDALQLSRILSISMPAALWGSAVTMTGMTFVNGKTNNSQGSCLVNDSAALTLDDCVFSSNFTNVSGGALWINSIYASPLNVNNSKFLGNVAFNGAGIYVGNNTSGLTTVPNTVVVNIQNTLFEANSSATTLTSNGGSGAGLMVQDGAAVTVKNSTFNSNSVGTSGSAIFIQGSTLTMSNSTVSNNAAINFGSSGAGQGGGIFLAATANTVANIVNSTVAFNVAGSPAGVSTGAGGGIFVGSGAKLFLDNSTLTGNSGNSTSTTGGGGGGLYMTGTAQVTVTNSTISGNSALSLGGGIMLNNLTLNATPSLAGSLVVRNSTVAFNTANGAGGGIEWRTSTGTGTPNVSITSSIVAQNFNPTSPDLKSGTAAQAFLVNNSLIGALDGGTLAGGSAANLTGTIAAPVDPLLDPLANNGGPTDTHALKAGSPAINAGSNTAGLAFDQRGATFNRASGTAADMGAFEVQVGIAPPTVTSVVVNNGAVQRSMVTSLKVTFSEAVTFPSGLAAAFTMTRTGPGGPTGAVNLSFVQVGNTVTITFVAGGAVGIDLAGSLIDGRYTFTINAANVLGIGGTLDGNANGGSQGSPTDNVVTTVTRLFGDADGDADVDAVDYGAFRAAFGGSNVAFDYDGDGDVDAVDFGQFRTRFGQSV